MSHVWEDKYDENRVFQVCKNCGAVGGTPGPCPNEGIIVEHEWADMAFHGSPMWECSYCGIPEKVTPRSPHCEKRAAALKIAERAREMKDKDDYGRILYLLKKFGGISLPAWKEACDRAEDAREN